MGERILLSRRTHNLISETIAGESIVIDLEDGRYYRASGLASALWEAMDHGAELDRLVSIAAADPANLERAAVARFAAGLIDLALVTCDADARAAIAETAAACPTASPDLVLESYDDMADLLLMDPVHDVGEQGWPSRPGDLGADP